MQINSVSSQVGSMIQGGVSRFAKMKETFEDLGSALEAGNLTEAKSAFAELQKNAPKSSDKSNDPMSSKMEALSEALDSGDLEAAQAAYADVKSALAQRPAGGKGGAGGPPPGGAPPAKGSETSSASSSSDSNQVYDKMDTNKDGVVSDEEKSAYLLKHPETSTQRIDSDRGLIDALA